uniref:F-box domain, leucine-rich repeat domain, L domain-like protein n=1 Tax=Tanacetum cinerariifolium TaxID=118510 RepID=A0A699JSW0_TANCI|nr:F-box domain, leucine-rich repeat domain, L domain-like protein [Tanacetum cinerariifolium]
MTGTYNVEKIRRARSENITTSEWDKGRPQPLRSTRHSLTPSLWYTLLTEMKRLEAMGTYTDDEINRLARGGKRRGHTPGVGKVLPARATANPSMPAHESTLNSLHKKVDFMMSLFKSDSKYSDMFSQFESCGASGSGGCGDEEKGVDHQDDEDEDGDGDTWSQGNMCHRGTYFLTGKYVGPTVSPGYVAGKESLMSIPHRPFPGDKSPRKPIPSDKSPGKAGICRWGRGLML